MNVITLSSVAEKNKPLVIHLPAEFPAGEVEIVVRHKTEPESVSATEAESEKPAVDMEAYQKLREEMRQKLLAGGLLVTDIKAPAGTVELSQEEI